VEKLPKIFKVAFGGCLFEDSEGHYVFLRHDAV